MVAAPASACAFSGQMSFQAASGLAAQHKAFKVSGVCELNFAEVQPVQRALACLSKDVPNAKLVAAVDKALALIEKNACTATLMRARKDGLVFEVCSAAYACAQSTSNTRVTTSIATTAFHSGAW